MIHRYLKNVVALKYDDEKCTGCRMCVEVYPRRLFRMENGEACVANMDLCMECGACAKNCTFLDTEIS